MYRRLISIKIEKIDIILLIILLSPFIIGLYLIFSRIVALGLLIGFFGVIIIFIIDRLLYIPDNLNKLKKESQTWLTFLYIFCLGSTTLGLSWGIEMSQIYLDFQGLKDNLPLLLTAMIGGLWGGGMTELLHNVKKIENKSCEEINSDTFKLKFLRMRFYTIIALVVFYIIMSLAFFISQ